MKKLTPFVAFFLALLFSALLSACGGGSNDNNASTASNSAPVPAVYAVSFNANGATNVAAPSPSTGNKAGDVIKLPEPGPLAVAGYHFNGWNTKANGTGNPYLPGSSLQVGTADTTLYAQWEVNKLKITQVGSGEMSRIVVEWYDGSKQDFAYGSEWVGLGTSYNLYTIVGGLAILLDGGTRYIHTCYPTDYLADHQPVMTVTADGKTVLNATSRLIADRSGDLAAPNATITANEVKIVVAGRLVDVEGDTNVEITLRADAPRMLLSQAKIAYTKPTPVSRMYHQMVHANPANLKGSQSYLFGKNGAVVEDIKVPTDITTGIFFKSDNFYTGFLAPMEGSKDLYSWVDGDYHAAYKIVYDNVTKKAGDTTITHGLSTWGFASTEATQLMNWANQVRQGATPAVEPTFYADVAKVNMIKKAFSN